MTQAQSRHEGHGQHTWPGAVHHLLNSHLGHLSCRIFFGKLCTTLLCECPQTLSPCVRVWPARLPLLALDVHCAPGRNHAYACALELLLCVKIIRGKYEIHTVKRNQVVSLFPAASGTAICLIVRERKDILSQSSLCMVWYIIDTLWLLLSNTFFHQTPHSTAAQSRTHWQDH